MSMKVSFDVVLESGNDDVDMDDALQTLSGTSSVVCLLGEAILTGRIVERRTRANDVRAKLKQSFRGSYGQMFDIQIEDQTLITRLKSMGRKTFSEVMRYYISEALYIDSGILSEDATLVIESMTDIESALLDRLESPLKDMHKITTSDSYDVRLNYRLPGDPFNIITLNENTAANIINVTENQNEIFIDAVITRFNTMTGNGRLILRDEVERVTKAFGFKDSLRFVTGAQKTAISENLHTNNTRREDDRVYMTLKVVTLTNNSGAVLKYLIKDVV